MQNRIPRSEKPTSLDIAVEREPVSLMRYLVAGKRGKPESALLPVYLGTAAWIPVEFDGLVITSDLQGVVPDEATGEMRQMGIAVVEHLLDLAAEEAVPPLASMAALLAGDLYSIPSADKRGGYGPVAEVWRSFAGEFAQLVGVAGNHDDVRGVPQGGHVRLLDMEITELGNLRVGGVGRTIGSPEKPGRRDPQEQLSRVELVAGAGVDILLLHQGPPGEPSQRGEPAIREIILENRIPLTICGHVHWEDPVARIESGWVLNSDGRVIILRRPA